MGKLNYVLKAASLGALFSSAAFAADLPKASELVSKMGMGINIGNTMEVPASDGGPTGWGNLFPTAEYIKSLKDAGFNTVRIPCAWYTHTTGNDSLTISTGWLDSVKTVVDMVIDNGMYAVLNSHWDKGWLENNIGESVNTTINARQQSYWTQIATFFKDYDEHLLFASTNEPGMHASNFNTNHMATLNTYHETMMQAVRNSGGNNATRTVIVQALQTDENLAHKLLKDNLPTDPAGTDYMMGEFHFYPYQFSLMEADESWGNCFYYWGEENYSTTDTQHNAIKGEYASPEYVDSVFQMLDNDFNIPMVIGEFGAIKRLNALSGENLKLHLQSRASFYGKVAELSKKHGFVPYAWDTGDEGNGNMTIIRRQTHKFEGNVGDITDYEVLNAMRKAYGMDTLAGNSIDQFVAASQDTSNKSAVLTYTSTRTDSSETGTLRIDLGGKDWSQYNAISFDLIIQGTTATVTTSEYPWANLSLFAMSGNSWAWDDYTVVKEIPTKGKWETYKIPLSAEGFNITDKSSVMAVGLNVYGTQFNGTMAIDNILLWKTDGTADTLESFNKNKPTVEGTASVTLQSTATLGGGLAISQEKALASKLKFNVSNGIINASFETPTAGKANVLLLNSLGQVVKSFSMQTKQGLNHISIEPTSRGALFLSIKQGSMHFATPIHLK